MGLTLGESLILGLLALLMLYTVIRDRINAVDARRRRKWRMYRGVLPNDEE